MGCYYMTASLPSSKGDGMIFSSLEEVQLAYSLGVVDTHAAISAAAEAGASRATAASSPAIGARPPSAA